VSSPYDEKPYEAFAVGDRATFTKTITEADILMFAAVSGDFYPLHVDEEYAKTTRFGKRAAHGMLSASLISTVIGMLLKKPGGLNVAQSMQYRAPVFVGDTLTAVCEVAEMLPDKRRMRTRTTVTNQRGEDVIRGEATIQKDPA
jgi:3-hydroxybutyryl-CoA dehydratase